ncbi:MAG: hypothetical protein PVH88_05220 [Ignavibacteria bacterium]
MKRLFLLISILLFSSLIYSQVKIKERIEIKPTQKKSLQKTHDSPPSSVYTPCGPYYGEVQHWSDKPEGHFWQTVWGGYYAPIDPFQQLFTLQRGVNCDVILRLFANSYYSPFKVEIVEGQEFCTFQEYGIIEDAEIENTYGYNDIPDSMLEEDGYVFVTGDILNDEYGYANSVKVYYNQKYYIKYNYVNSNSFVTLKFTSVLYPPPETPPVYYHTLIAKRDFAYENDTIRKTIPNYEELNLNIHPDPLHCVIDEYERGGDLPDSVKFNVSIIKSTEYGILKRYNEDQEIFDSTFTNLTQDEYDQLSFLAGGNYFEDSARVEILIEPTDEDIEPVTILFTILPNPIPPIKVEFDPEHILPGDTSTITLSRRLEDSDQYVLFPYDQVFSIYTNNEKDYGDIYSIRHDIRGNRLDDVLNGFMFIANDTIDAEHVTAIVGAKTKVYPDAGSSASSFNGGGELNNTVKSASSLSKEHQLNQTSDYLDKPTTIYGEGSLKISREIEEGIQIEFEGNEIPPDWGTSILLRWNQGGEIEDFPSDQRFDIEILEGEEYGDLYYFGDGYPQMEKSFTDALNYFAFGSYDSISVDTAEVIIRATTEILDGSELKILEGEEKLYIIEEKDSLTIISPEEEDEIYYITNTPEMPSITCRAEFSGDNIPENQTANWSCSVAYDYPPGDDEETYNAEIVFGSDNITEWNLNFNNSEIIIGGKATIIVTTTVDDEEYADTIVVHIRGENPEDATVIALTDDGEQAMIETEVPSYSQFRTENYDEPNERLPIRGGDRHGWGMCQLDDRSHTITTALLWDWTANFEYGTNYYNQQRNGAERRMNDDINLHGPIAGQTRQSMIDIEGYARYNGGPSARVWRWIPATERNPGRWVRNVTAIRNGVRRYNPDIDEHAGNYEGNYNN